jgi:hypothetical protein
MPMRSSACSRTCRGWRPSTFGAECNMSAAEERLVTALRARLPIHFNLLHQIERWPTDVRSMSDGVGKADMARIRLRATSRRQAMSAPPRHLAHLSIRASQPPCRWSWGAPSAVATPIIAGGYASHGEVCRTLIALAFRGMLARADLHERPDTRPGPLQRGARR